MADESYSFSTARNRLEAIVAQVRKKDTSLEKSLDLLEEGVRLANACTELIDHADGLTSEVAADAEAVPSDDAWADDGAPADEPGADDDPSADER
jgi:exodeoxyribonuclease VII small subunit